MKSSHWKQRVAIVGLCGIAGGILAPRLLAVPRVRDAQPESVAPTVIFTSPAQPPKGAVVLFSGKEDELKSNFYKRYSKDDSTWTVDAAGVATPAKSDLTSKKEYGDCYAHVEFREPVDADGHTLGEGNSGIGFQGRYEVQILDSYGKNPENTSCGAFYSQKAPLVTASKKPNEWQTYDIIFRAPRFDADGKQTEKARATVIQNGIVVQNNEEFNGPTGIQYGENKGEVKTGPLIIQGDHDPVQFRKIWVVPM